MAVGVRLTLVLLIAPLVAHLAFAVVPGFASYVVLSGSMEPTLEPDSVVYVQGTGNYQVGDVIAFAREESIVTHRVVAIRPGGLVTKGDANDQPDPWRVQREDVRGEVVGSVPLYGRLVRFASTTMGFLLLVVVPGVALLLCEMRRLVDLLGE